MSPSTPSRPSSLRPAAPALALFFALGCGAAGFDRGPQAPRPPSTPPVVDDGAVAAAFADRGQLPARPRIAVHFVADQRFAWPLAVRQTVLEAGEDLPDVELFPLLSSTVEGEDHRALRVAAARHGADGVLVLRGLPEQIGRENGWVATYALILPVFFAPGQELHTRFRVEAVLTDVRNDFLYATAEGEAERHQQAPPLLIDPAGQLAASRDEAVGFLAEELRTRLGNLFGEPAAAGAPTP